MPIGEDNDNATSEEESIIYYFTGTYEGNDKTIDGIMFVNSPKSMIGLFTGLDNGTLQNLTIGENSIFFIDKNNESYSYCIYIGGLVAYPVNSTIENCTNNAKIVIKNLEIDDEYHSYHTICGINSFGNNTQITNCTNNGNITVDNCKFYCLSVNGIVGNLDSLESDKQILVDTCINNGNIIVKNNSNLSLNSGGIIAAAYTVNVTTCANKGNITIPENTVTEEIDCDIYMPMELHL